MRTTDAEGSTSIDECVCEEGSEQPPNGQFPTCVCQIGYYYASSVQTPQCTKCPSNATTFASDSQSPSDCVCIPGSFGDGLTDCQLCSPGSYAPSYNLTECLPCPTSSTSPEGSVDLSACVCTQGHELVNGTCQACPIGKYKNVTGDHACTECPFGSTTDGNASLDLSDCQCSLGYFASSTGIECTACPVGEYADNLASTSCKVCAATSPPGSPGFTTTIGEGSTSIDDCVCEAGYAGGDSVACTPCPNATFKAVASNGDCSLCPRGTTGPRGANSSTQCECQESTIASEDGTACLCRPDFYVNPDADNDIINYCLACPDLSTSPVNTTTIDGCKCRPGSFGANASLCQLCAIVRIPPSLLPSLPPSLPPCSHPYIHPSINQSITQPLDLFLDSASSLPLASFQREPLGHPRDTTPTPSEPTNARPAPRLLRLQGRAQTPRCSASARQGTLATTDFLARRAQSGRTSQRAGARRAKLALREGRRRVQEA